MPIDRRRLLQMIAIAGAICAYTTIVLGGTVRGMGAGLACQDWPLCKGHVVPDLRDPLVAIEYAHRLVVDQRGAPRRTGGPRRPHNHEQPQLGHRHDASRLGNRNLREQSPCRLFRPPAIVPGSAVPSRRGLSLLDEEMHDADRGESDQDERKPSRTTIRDETREEPAGEDR